MKKITAVIIAAIMIVSFSACAKPGNEDASASEEDSVMNDGGIAGMPSPMNEVASLDELGEKAGCSLVKPEGVELSDESFCIIDAEPQIAQYMFTVGGVRCTLRFAAAGIENDISGIYTEDGTLFDNAEDATLYIENDELKAQRWVTVDGQYIFAVDDAGEWEWADFEAICSQFRKLEPRNWNSDVPFADYQAIEGEYDSEDGSAVASVNIVGDHAGVYVIVDQEDGSRLYWEMEAVLEDGKLSYEKEIISSVVFDENAGGTVKTPLENGGAGSVEIKDGTLVFADAFSEQLKSLVLAVRPE